MFSVVSNAFVIGTLVRSEAFNQSGGHARAQIVPVGCPAFDDGAETDDTSDPTRFRQTLRRKWHFERTRDSDDFDVVGIDVGAAERFESSFEELVGNRAIEPRDDDTEASALTVWLALPDLGHVTGILDVLVEAPPGLLAEVYG